MQKRTIRCYLTTSVFDNTSTDVYYLLYQGLYICINCGELFYIDSEDPKTSGLTIDQIAINHSCPKCNFNLVSKLKNYPETFITTEGELAHYNSSNEIPPGEESVIIEVWQIRPPDSL